jgi:hypothetical protein
LKLLKSAALSELWHAGQTTRAMNCQLEDWTKAAQQEHPERMMKAEAQEKLASGTSAGSESLMRLTWDVHSVRPRKAGGLSGSRHFTPRHLLVNSVTRSRPGMFVSVCRDF